MKSETWLDLSKRSNRWAIIWLCIGIGLLLFNFMEYERVGHFTYNLFTPVIAWGACLVNFFMKEWSWKMYKRTKGIEEMAEGKRPRETN